MKPLLFSYVLSVTMSAMPPPSNGGGADPPDGPDRNGDKARKRDRANEAGPSNVRSKDPKPREENSPFSFRQFLAQPSGGSGDASNVRNTGARPKTRPRVHHQPPEQQHETNGEAPHRGSGLPDFVRDYMSPASPPDVSAASSLPFDLTREEKKMPEPQPVSAEADAAYPSLSLPDFLSDGVLANAEPTSSSSSDVIAIAANASEAAEAPNTVEALRAEVSNLRVALDRERERSRSLEIRLERNRREGNCLEETEVRLAQAVSRAEHAEKVLRDCEASKRKLENQIMRQSNASGSVPHNLVLMRVRRAAAQISLASEVAETSLGQLLSGVESLKTVADELREIIGEDDDQDLKGACGKSA